MRPITIRNFFRKKGAWALAALLLLGGGYAVATAQPGVSPNFAWLRGAALGSTPALVCQGLDAVVGCNVVTQGGGTLQVNGVPVAVGGGTISALTINPGPLTVTGTSALTGPVNITGTTTLTGPLLAIPGTSATPENVGGIVLANNGTNVTTTLAATEQDLFTFTVLANTLSANNQFLKLTFRDRNAATGNTKQLRVYFGATLIGDSTAVAANNNWWNGDCYIWRTGAATQKAVCTGNNITNGASWSTAAGGGANVSTPAETLSGPVVLRVTGTDGVAAGGTNLEGVNLLWYPAGQ